ncbi:MAG: DUF5357 domain-containing protein [Leptolyngbya sp. SIO4C1]|nr:DUF5357 domain-containing protein [Leptolyngbya sp. SIO4C1]
MLEIFRDSVNQVRILITPTQYFAWQTLLLLSLFSWLLAVIAQITGAEELTVNILSTGSWLFLTISVWWALAKNPVRVFDVNISPWITGAIFCTFLFNPWTEERFEWALSSWPMISTLIAVLPKFVNKRWDGFVLPPQKDRQRVALTLLVNLLLTGWILFFFRVQTWVGDYPSLLADDFSQSSFVSQFGERLELPPQGRALLEDAALALNQQLDGVPWARVERWLVNIDDGIQSLAREADMSAQKEVVFWRLTAPLPEATGDGYQLRLRAQWLGPTSYENGYYLERVCTIRPQSQPRVVETNPAPGQSATVRQELNDIARVDCGSGEPTLQVPLASPAADPTTDTTVNQDASG